MQYVAFLRAINTGSHRIKMTDLAQFFRDCGYAAVSTYIASGNVIFDSDAPPDIAGIESAFQHEFSFPSEVFLRDRDQIRSIVDRAPWTDLAGVTEVSFLERAPTPEAAAALEATAVAPEELAVSGSEVFFLRIGKGTPTVHKETTAMRLLGMKMTRRGLATVVKIHERFLPPVVAPSDRSPGSQAGSDR
jgi:uncharacterized protein (DUF1697 family)